MTNKLPTTEPTSPDLSAQRNLATFLTWIIVIDVISVLLYLGIWFFVPELVLLLLAGVVLLAGFAFIAARLSLARGHVQAAINIVCTTLLIAGLGVISIAPVLLPIIVILPILAVACALPFIDSRGLLRIIVLGLLVSVLTVVLGIFKPLPLSTPPLLGTLAMPTLLPIVVGLVLGVLWYFHRQLSALLARSDAANSALREAQAGLEDQVHLRTAELRGALSEIEARSNEQARLLEENSQQREAIREMSVPVLPVAAGTLVIPLIGALDSARIQQLHEQALGSIERAKVRRVLLDVTGVAVIDTQVAKGLIQTVEISRLLGAEAILIGIRPEVAQAIVSLGLDLSAIRTYPNLEAALTLAN